MTLDVPAGDTLPGWANDAQKRQPAQVLFRASAGGSVVETLALKAAYCVRYHEQFVHGDAQSGAYQCQLTLSDPDGWTLTAGGPATAFVAPSAREHGLPGAVAGALRDKTIGGNSRTNGASNALPVSSREVDVEKLFENPALHELRNKILAGAITRKHADVISVEEQAIIAYYTTAEGYRQFNLALRGQAPMTEFFKAQESILNGALKKLPKFQGSVVRGTGESETPRFANAKDGDVIEYENFVSSSTEEIIADDFMYRKNGEYVLRITSKNGVQITDMSMAQAEEEILFQSKKKFKVTGKSFRPRFTEDDPLVREVYLEEI